MSGWISYKLEYRLLGEISTTLRYANDTTLIDENEEELKNFLMGVKEESEKVSLKLKIKKKKREKTKIMIPIPLLHGK